MTASTKKSKAPKVDRRPYAHAGDMREALVGLEAVLKELGEDGHRYPLFLPPPLTKTENVTCLAPSALMSQSWEITDYAERLRAAAKRVLVAKVGLRHARRWDGWRRPEARS